MQKVRWGVLSTAKIGMEKVTPALQRSLDGLILTPPGRGDR